MSGVLWSKRDTRPFGMGIHEGPPPDGHEGWHSWEEAEFDNLPENTAYFSHSLPLAPLRKPGERNRVLFTRWGEKDFPLLFHYRDPRAVLSSVMHYCMNRIAGNVSSHSSWIRAVGDVLEGMSDDDTRLTATLELMPEYMNRQYREHLWLLWHPKVCRTSFEGLAGPKARGCETTQRKSVARMMVHLGISGSPVELASSLFSEDVRTFSRGRVGRMAGRLPGFSFATIREQVW